MNTNSELVAKRYAKALWESVGIAKAPEELKSFARAVELYLSSDDLQKLFSNPAFAMSDKKKVLTDISTKVGFSSDFQNFMALLLERGRISIIGAIFESFKEKIMTSDGIHALNIETALPIAEAEQKKIVSSLEKRFGTKFVASVDIVPELIAGIRVNFLGKTIDASLTGVLFQMKQKFLGEEYGTTAR